MLEAPIDAAAHSYHLSYSVQLSHGGLVVALYVVAVCGALLFSGYRHIAIFGLANLAAVALLARLTLDGFTSLWCAYAALAAAAIALHMRHAKPHHERPDLLT
jgi:hypothetical protein